MNRDANITLSKTSKLLELEKNNPKVQLLLNNLDFFDNICNFILEKGESLKYEFKTLSKLSNDDAFNLSNLVLSTFSSSYPSILEQYREDNRLIVTDESKNLMGSGNAFLDDKDNKIKIRLGLHSDIFDPYLIVHEFMHSLNENNPRSLDRELLTEGFAIYSEYLVSDYLENNNINNIENTELLKLRLFTMQSRLSNLKEYIHNIRELNTNKDELNISDEEISMFDIGNFLSTIQYAFGNITAIMLYKRHQDGLFDNDTYSRLNEEMKDSSDYKVFNELFINGLDYNEFVSSYESIIKYINKENSLAK